MENALFWDFPLAQKPLLQKNGSQFFLQELTQYGSMIEVYIKAKI